MRIGIDLGGTKIELAALDDDGTIRYRRRVPTPRGDYAGTIAAIAELVSSAEETLRCRATVGIGMPGAISPATGLVKNANSTWLNGRPLDVDLARALGREVRLANDANCFALSEATDGAAAGAAIVFGVIVGTGTGGGLVVRGEICTGANAIGGEWGHNPLPWPEDDERPGPPCYCGRRGCLETFLSGPGFSRDYEERTGEQLDAAAIAARADERDPQALAAIERYAHRMARGLATVINVVDPDVIVLGGGMSNIAPLYTRVPELLPAFVFSDHVATRIVPPVHGDASGVRGAAWLWGRAEAAERAAGNSTRRAQRGAEEEFDAETAEKRRGQPRTR
ncbi:MAG TPA: fructokinase [Vicinamibacterales bacterium]|nr:fructokinase [Vicinamibacterales bacterium]